MANQVNHTSSNANHYQQAALACNPKIVRPVPITMAARQGFVAPQKQETKTEEKTQQVWSVTVTPPTSGVLTMTLNTNVQFQQQNTGKHVPVGRGHIATK